MANVNPAKTAELNARFFLLQQEMLMGNHINFFKDFESLVKKWEAQSVKNEILNRVFIKTATIIKGVVPVKDETIQSLLGAFEKAANERGITDVCIDGAITGWFPEERVTNSIPGDSRLLRFVGGILHSEVIGGAKQLAAYQEYDLGDAIQRATQLVAAGEVGQKNNTGVTLYLTNKRDGVSYRLLVWRHTDGQLRLTLSQVRLTRECGAGSGVLVSNENLGE